MGQLRNSLSELKARIFYIDYLPVIGIATVLIIIAVYLAVN